MEQKKYLQDNLLLTKEAFEQYTLRLREERAKEFGMSLEEWDKAVREGQIINPITHNTQQSTTNNTKENDPSITWNGPTSSFNG